MRRAHRRRAVVRVQRGYRTPTKTRILAGGVHSAKQQVVRIDRAAASRVCRRGSRRDRSAACSRRSGAATRCSFPTTASAWSRRRSSRRAADVAAGRMRSRRCSSTRATRCSVSADDGVHAERVRSGAAARRPHRRERARARAGGRDAAEADAARQAVLITRGSRGMALFEPDRPTVHIPIFGSDQIADVTGAGDTVIATMTLALAAGGTFEEAARLANYAGGLVVMKRGTATVTADELRQAIAGRRGLTGQGGSSSPRAAGRRASPRDRARRPHDRVRQRLLRSAARRPRPLPAGGGRGKPIA